MSIYQQNDWIGEDESVKPQPKPKRAPVTIEDEGSIKRISAQYDDKDFMVYRFDRLANDALNDERPQYNSAVTALAHIAKIKGFGNEPKTVINNNNIAADLSSLSYEEKVAKAKEIAERLQMMH